MKGKCEEVSALLQQMYLTAYSYSSKVEFVNLSMVIVENLWKQQAL